MSKYFPTFARAFRAVKQAWLYVRNRYEAAYQQWGARRYIFSPYQDARFDVDFSCSMEICRKHLDLISNVPLIQRIRNLKIQFAVGVDGLMVVPNASDPAMDKKAIEQWNETRADRWEAWARSPELGSNLSLNELTIQWEGMLFDVGNVIIHKTRDELGQPKIQTIDRLRLQTPPSLSSEEGKSIIQGIRLTQIQVPVHILEKGKMVTKMKDVTIGKPASYFIRDEFDKDIFREIPAKEIIHKFRALRPGMMVGIPEAFSVINTLIDYTDLHILEMGAAKQAGDIANVETNATGELDTLAARRIRMSIQSQNGQAQSITKPSDQFYNVSFGARNIALKHGDSIKNFQIERPTIAQQQYWDLKLTEICIGYNVPKLLVVPYSLQGTVTRADLDVCSTAFRGDFEIIRSIVREIYEWQTEWAVKFDRGLDGKRPANYVTCEIRPPRAPNVDIGYTADALAKEVEMGLKTFQSICAERNLNWIQVLQENAEFQAAKQRIAKQYSSPEEGIIIDPNSISFTQFASGKTAQSEPKEEPAETAA